MLVNKKLGLIINIGFLFALMVISVSYCTLLDTSDIIHTEDNRRNVFCFNDEQQPFNPHFELTIDLEYGYGCSSEECGSVVFGSFHLFDEINNHSIIFQLKVVNNSITDVNCTPLSNDFFDMTLSGRTGRNVYSIDFLEYYQNYSNETVDKIYCYDTDTINDPNLLQIMYENYFNESCMLNGVNITNQEWINYFGNNSGYGVFYNACDLGLAQIISIGVNFYKDEGNMDYNLIISLSMVGGSAISGLGIYKIKKHRKK